VSSWVLVVLLAGMTVAFLVGLAWVDRLMEKDLQFRVELERLRTVDRERHEHSDDGRADGDADHR